MFREIGNFARGFALSIFVLALAFTPRLTLAASAVAVDKNQRIFATQVESELDTAISRANKTCHEMGGNSCETVVSCFYPGHGAVAVYKPTGAYFATCGARTKKMAEDEAVSACRLRMPQDGQASCTLATHYHDKNPRPITDRNFFSGRWSSDCGSREWYRFRFVSSWEFQVDACEGGIDSCEALKDVYSPDQADNTFIYPTSNHKLIKLGPDKMRWERLDYTTLKRCS